MKIIDRSRDVIARFRWAYMKFSPGVVPKWRSNRGLTCSARSGSRRSGVSSREIWPTERELAALQYASTSARAVGGAVSTLPGPAQTLAQQTRRERAPDRGRPGGDRVPLPVVARRHAKETCGGTLADRELRFVELPPELPVLACLRPADEFARVEGLLDRHVRRVADGAAAEEPRRPRRDQLAVAIDEVRRAPQPAVQVDRAAEHVCV